MNENTIYSPRTEHPTALVLVSEISHRVVNEYTYAIASIRLAAAGLASPEARQVLAEATATLRNFADAHRALQLPCAAGAIDLGDYLTRLCAATMAAGLTERGVRLQLSCDTVHLSSERCWRVALILSELITNSVRHGLRGGPGQVTVEIEDDGATVSCRVIDDGIAQPTIQPARGVSVVSGLAADLDGQVVWRFGASGTTATLSFPKHPGLGA
jgi:two-component sensor histidine kinase